jgi:ribonuclease P protein component
MASSSGCAPELVERSLRGAGVRVEPASPLEGLGTDERPSAHGDRHKSGASLQGFRFPRVLRLTSRRQFQAVYAHGLKAATPCFAVFAKPNGLDHCRIGLTLTKKTGCAVVRNRAKRVLRELFRLNRHRFQVPMDLVINGRRSMLKMPTARVERELVDSVGRLGRRAAR